MKIITITNNKGGVAKTTSVHSIGAALSRLNKKVLLIDLDPQGNLSSAFGINIDSLEKTVYNAMQERNPNSYILEIEENLHILPSNLLLEKANIEFSALPVREMILDKTLKKLETKYDICLIDTSPSLSLLTTNAISCADSIYIPVKAGFYEMKGSKLLIDLITELKNDINEKLEIKGLFITQYDSRTNIAQAVIETIENNMPGKLMKTRIRNNVALVESPANASHIFDYDKSSNGAKDYLELTKEILEKEGML